MSTDAINRIRERFERDAAANVGLYHQIDIDRVRNEQWQVSRYLQYYDNDEDVAFKEMCATLQWKQSFGLHERNHQYFPKELWEIYGIEITGKDTAGRLALWESLSGHRSGTEFGTLVRQFIAYTLERADHMAGEGGFVIVADAHGAGLSNIEMDFAKFRISLLDHFPMGIRAYYIVELPWILNSVSKIILSLMNARLRAMVQFVKKDELIPKYFDVAQVSTELGGTKDKFFLPEEIQSSETMRQAAKRLGFTDEKTVDSFYKTFKV